MGNILAAALACFDSDQHLLAIGKGNGALFFTNRLPAADSYFTLLSRRTLETRGSRTQLHRMATPKPFEGSYSGEAKTKPP